MLSGRIVNKGNVLSNSLSSILGQNRKIFQVTKQKILLRDSSQPTRAMCFHPIMLFHSIMRSSPAPENAKGKYQTSKRKYFHPLFSLSDFESWKFHFFELFPSLLVWVKITQVENLRNSINCAQKINNFTRIVFRLSLFCFVSSREGKTLIFVSMWIFFSGFDVLLSS